MITAETIASAPKSSFYNETRNFPFRVGDWLAAGIWAVKADAETLIALAKEDHPECEGGLTAWTDRLPGVPVVEDESLRLPFVRGKEEVSTPCPGECDGGTVECDLGHEHDCETCGGNGNEVSIKGVPDDLGQRVYVGGGVTTLVQAGLGPLLDGYRVVRLGAKDIDALGGLDEAGQLVVVVMPMRGDVRRVP